MKQLFKNGLNKLKLNIKLKFLNLIKLKIILFFLWEKAQKQKN